MMNQIREPHVYETKFAKSDITDRVLVVSGKKLHVNKLHLCYNSTYFQALFNSEFKEKSLEEIPIEEVNFEDFATLLSLIHPNPLEIKEIQIEGLLNLADQFLLLDAKRQVELFICSTEMDKYEKLKLADFYNLEIVLNRTVLLFTTKEDFHRVSLKSYGFSDQTKARLFGRYFELFDYLL